MPNCKEKRSLKWLYVQSLAVHASGRMKAKLAVLRSVG